MYAIKQSLCFVHTFSGRVSTLNRIRPRQSRRTIATDEERIIIGFLATYDPYFLITLVKKGQKYSILASKHTDSIGSDLKKIDM